MPVLSAVRSLRAVESQEERMEVDDKKDNELVNDILISLILSNVFDQLGQLE